MRRMMNRWQTWTPGLAASAAAMLVTIGACVGHQLVGPLEPLNERILVWLPIPTTLAGLVVWRRRPGVLAGPALVALGMWRPLYLFASLSFEPLPFTIAMLLQSWIVPLLLAAWLTFPSYPLGRLGWAAVSLAALSFVLQAVTAPFLDFRDFGCSFCPDGINLLLVESNPEFVRQWDRVWLGLAVLSILMALGILLRRLVTATGPSRRVLVPLLVPLVIALSGEVFQIVIDQVSIAMGGTFLNNWAQEPRMWIELATELLIPLGVVLGIYAEGRRRDRVGELAASAQRDASALTQGVRRALADPAAELVLGATAPATPEGHARTALRARGAIVGWLVHEEAAGDDARLLAAVAEIAALVLDAQQQVDQLAATLADVQASRRRLLDADDRARRRVEADLEAGPLAQLQVALRATADAQEHAPSDLQPALQDVRREAQRAIGELRDLAQGLTPPALHEDGLGGALRELADRAPVTTTILAAPGGRLDHALEATVWFVVAEAIANAAKHAGADHIAVTVEEDGETLHVTITDDGCGGADPAGHGLAGLAGRVAADGGTLEVTSPPGAGTTITAELPLAATSAPA